MVPEDIPAQTPLRILIAGILAIVFICALTVRAHANDGVLGMTPDGVYAVNQNDVVMVNEEIRIKLDAGQVFCEFEFRNTGKAQDVLMGFPAVSSDEPGAFTTEEDLTVRNFKAWTKYGAIKVFMRDSSSKSLKGLEHFNQYEKWYCFYVHFRANETKTIYHSYDVTLSYDSSGNISAGYIIRTGALWKGNIGHSKIIFDFENLPVYSLERFSPSDCYRFEGNTLVWEGSDYEPSSNLSISFNSYQYSDEYMNMVEVGEARLAKISLFKTPIDFLYRYRPYYVGLYLKYMVEKPVEALYLKGVLNIGDADLLARIPEKRFSNADEFVQMIMDALNNNDTLTLAKYYDSVYGETTAVERKALPEGLKLYHGFVFGNLERYEFAGNLDVQYDTPNTTGKQYWLISDTAGSRDIRIKCYPDGKFRYDDPLLFYGPELASRVNAYINAIKTEDIGYLYDHYIGIGDPVKEPYSVTSHNEEYEKIARQLIDNYKKTYKLGTIEYYPTGKVSGVCNYHGLSIEYFINGNAPGEFGENHIFSGVYEFPVFSVNDPWLTY